MDMLSLRKRAAFAFITLILSTMFALALAEIVLRLLEIGYGNAPLEAHPVLNHAHPKDYTFLSHTPSNEYGGFHVYYGHDGRTISASEWKMPSLQPDRVCRVAFFGDSLPNLVKSRSKNSFVGLIPRHSACEVRNYGVSSYSPIFYLSQWRHEVKEFRPTMVIVQLYSNDVGGDADFAKSAQLDADGLPTAIPGPPDNVITRMLRNSYVARLVRKAQLTAQWWLSRDSQQMQVVGGFVEENPDISAFSSKLMKALAKDVRGSGAGFAFFVVPSSIASILLVRLSTPEF